MDVEYCSYQSFLISHLRLSIIHVPPVMLRPELLIFRVRLDFKWCWPRKGHKGYLSLLKLLQPGPRVGLTLVHAVDLDPMTRTRHMQSPIPRTPHIRRLRIETVVPASNTQLQPPLRIDWQVNSPGAPRIFVLLEEVLRVDVVRDVAAVGRDLNTFRPMPATTVGPFFDADVAVVNDDFFSPASIVAEETGIS